MLRIVAAAALDDSRQEENATRLIVSVQSYPSVPHIAFKSIEIGRGTFPTDSTSALMRALLLRVAIECAVGLWP